VLLRGSNEPLAKTKEDGGNGETMQEAPSESEGSTDDAGAAPPSDKPPALQASDDASAAKSSVEHRTPSLAQLLGAKAPPGPPPGVLQSIQDKQQAGSGGTENSLPGDSSPDDRGQGDIDPNGQNAQHEVDSIGAPSGHGTLPDALEDDDIEGEEESGRASDADSAVESNPSSDEESLSSDLHSEVHPLDLPTTRSGHGMGEVSRMVSGHLRTELVKSHLRRPRISVVKLQQYIRWVNCMHVWHSEVTMLSLAEEIRTGLLLCNLMQRLVPGTSYRGLNKRPLSRKPCVANLEQAIGVIWRSGRVNNTRVPSADDVYDGKTDKIAVLLEEIFEVYVLRDLRKMAPTVLDWFQNILEQYNFPLPEETLLPPFDGVWEHFQSGTALFCVLYHFHGQALVGTGDAAREVNAAKVYRKPRNLQEFRSNVAAIFDILTALGIMLFWSVDDWLNFRDTDFALLQLACVYERFKSSHCAIPPAKNNLPGISSGERGEPIIVGLEFADSAKKRPGPDHALRLLLGDDTGPGRLKPVPLVDGRILKLPRGLLASAADHEGLTKCSGLEQGHGKSRASSVAQTRGVTSARPVPGAASRADAHDRIRRLELKKSELDFRIESLQRQSNVLSATMFNRQLHALKAEKRDMVEKLLELRQGGRGGASTTTSGVGTGASTGLPFTSGTQPASPRPADGGLDPERKGPPSVTQRDEDKMAATKQQTPRAKELEQGWISSTQKWDTTNRVIHKKQSDRRKVSELVQSPSKYASVLLKKHEQNQVVLMGNGDSAWEAFKARLQITQAHHVKKLEAQEVQALSTLEADLASHQRKTHAANLGHPSHDLESLKNAIRQEELRLMHVEEHRRLMVMREERASLLHDAAMCVRTAGFQATESTAADADPGHAFGSRQRQNEEKPGSKNAFSPSSSRVQAASLLDSREFHHVGPGVQWLMTPRTLALVDRNSARDFEFYLTSAESLTSDPTKKSAYAFVWVSQQGLAGFVLLPDVDRVVDIQGPSPMFSIVLKPRNPMAVVGTGGIYEPRIQCTSATESFEYAEQLRCLLRASA